ncbi:MAG: nuclear transport factor 2 family protein [Verrucomicrobia bacterium]|nr:nuclear transport factor 2 family protein [Verrucomicrobiota bacterium]
MKWVFLFCLCGLFLVIGLGCSSVPRVTDSAAGFRAIRAEMEARPTVVVGSPAERQGIERLKLFLSRIDAEAVRSQTLTVYAPDAYLNDTLVSRRGATNIQTYFQATVEAAESITANIEDVSRSADGFYYVRWTMDVRMKKVAAGETIRTLGITLVRFDDQGRVLIHQDYWDSAAGLWDHVPGIGRGIRWIKGRLEQ